MPVLNAPEQTAAVRQTAGDSNKVLVAGVSLKQIRITRIAWSQITAAAQAIDLKTTDASVTYFGLPASMPIGAFGSVPVEIDLPVGQGLNAVNTAGPVIAWLITYQIPQ